MQDWGNNQEIPIPGRAARERPLDQRIHQLFRISVPVPVPLPVPDYPGFSVRVSDI